MKRQNNHLFHEEAQGNQYHFHKFCFCFEHQLRKLLSMLTKVSTQ